MPGRDRLSFLEFCAVRGCVQRSIANKLEDEHCL